MPTRILLVEDDVNIALLVQYNLEAAGYEVEHIERGDLAEKRIGEYVPDLLVLNWLVPGTSGIELCRRIRCKLGLDKLPIIMMTANADLADKDYAMRLGADDFLARPFALSDLLSRAQALMARTALAT